MVVPPGGGLPWLSPPWLAAVVPPGGGKPWLYPPWLATSVPPLCCPVGGLPWLFPVGFAGVVPPSWSPVVGLPRLFPVGFAAVGPPLPCPVSGLPEGVPPDPELGEVAPPFAAGPGLAGPPGRGVPAGMLPLPAPGWCGSGAPPEEEPEAPLPAPVGPMFVEALIGPTGPWMPLPLSAPLIGLKFRRL